MSKPIKNTHVRNFSIIAHIDHGKSTLSDRFIEFCGGLSSREMTQQVLDSMDIEKERGITIKAQSVTLSFYNPKNKETYQFNFIDTPGHVDFSYEVSRSLSACDGALLIVDASQGVEAQTVANCYSAIEQNLEIIPVINKIDLPAADVEKAKKEIEDVIGINAEDAIAVSAKSGIGIEELLIAIAKRIPAPKNNEDKPLRALIIDSWFDNYLGVVSLVKVESGSLNSKSNITVMSTGETHQTSEVGVFTPKRTPKEVLNNGSVGYVIAGVKDIFGVPVGDTLTLTNNSATEPLEGFQEIQPRVFAGLYPISSESYEDLKEALSKLKLNDAALQFEPETSDALGFGFRCGFLGLLHMEIIQERIEREYDIQLISTTPTVIYKVQLKTGEEILIESPSRLPDTTKIEAILEPMINAEIFTPNEYVGNIISLCMEKRGRQKNIQYLGSQVQLSYKLPLAEVVINFFEKLKSASRGYASMDYDLSNYQESDLVKVDIMINGERVDALANLMHRSFAEFRGRIIIDTLKAYIPRQMFEVALQAAIGGKIIARNNVKALRKNVTAKCYGGDISRKRKLLEKQKKGKKRMKTIGKVELPQEAFKVMLHTGS